MSRVGSIERKRFVQIVVELSLKFSINKSVFAHVVQFRVFCLADVVADCC